MNITSALKSTKYSATRYGSTQFVYYTRKWLSQPVVNFMTAAWMPCRASYFSPGDQSPHENFVYISRHLMTNSVIYRCCWPRGIKARHGLKVSPKCGRTLYALSFLIIINVNHVLKPILTDGWSCVSLGPRVWLRRVSFSLIFVDVHDVPYDFWL